MQHDVLIVDSQPQLVHILSKLVRQAGLNPIVAYTLEAAKERYLAALPETFLCALISYTHKDAEPGQAIHYFSDVALPTIAVSPSMDVDIRNHVLRYDIVDYVGLENAQTLDYVLRLIQRLNDNKNTGVVLHSRSKKACQSTRALLQRHGFRIYISDTIAKTNELLLNRDDIRLVMLDADDNGEKLASFVADIRKTFTKDDVAIVGFSHKKSDFLAAHFIKCGATDFFTLPFAHEEFLLRIMQMLEAIEHVELIKKTANQDYLTGLPNRRHFFYSVNKLHPAHLDLQALALIDLDHFKSINDTFGHDAGDAVLKNTARLIATHFEHAHVARFGGEEFCIYIQGVPFEQVIEAMDNLRAAIEATQVDFQGTRLSATASIGLTRASHSNIEAMLSQADDLLYQAKHQGRNRVCYTD